MRPFRPVDAEAMAIGKLNTPRMAARQRLIIRVSLILAGVLGLSSCVALMTFALACRPFNVPSQSNLPTLEPGDYVLASCYDSGCRLPQFFPKMSFSEPEAGDMAVFRKSADTDIIYVKRIVGLPGDRVQMRNGDLYINDRPIHQRQISNPGNRNVPSPRNLPQQGLNADGAASPASLIKFEETLPNGRRYLVNRLFPENELSTTAVFKVPPGRYLVLGDNRDNSSDSRDPSGVGFVPRGAMIGRVRFVAFSLQRPGRFLQSVDVSEVATR